MKSFKNFTEIEEAEYKGRKVDLNNPTRASDGKKKFSCNTQLFRSWPQMESKILELLSMESRSKGR